MQLVNLCTRTLTIAMLDMFNKLPSPSPSIAAVRDKYKREAIEDLLDDSILSGMKTPLYPYQRRTAACMLETEAVARFELDPRLERRIGPDGKQFYYNAWDFQFLKYPRYYETCRGGILAESMGLGKTIICLSLILATKNHLPKIPVDLNRPAVKPTVPSLLDTAISGLNRSSFPWKVEFHRIQQASGESLSRFVKQIEERPPVYEIPSIPTRWNRTTSIPPPRKLTLAATTLVVVPRNLCKQWESEIRKHVEQDMLKLLVMDNLKKTLPPAEELRRYDIVLFSRNRFEMEVKDGADSEGRRISQTTLLCRCPYIGSSRIRDCNCLRPDMIYESPLKRLHFLRLIVDEGHFFTNSNINATVVANKLVKADHKWIVSGTPAKDLMGAEVDISANENHGNASGTEKSRDIRLEQRRDFSKEDTKGAIENLFSLASNFLNIRPWAAADNVEGGASWKDYVYRHEKLRRRTFKAFSSCFRRTLESIIIKTRPNDVEKEIQIPAVSHAVVRLEPSFYDKMTANLFTHVLTANAVTSERTDADYLFHKNSQKARNSLVSNLRQSAFFWTGFSVEDVMTSIKISSGYLAKTETRCPPADRALLLETLSFTETILASQGWQSMSKLHELGISIENWPSPNTEQWAFDEGKAPLLTGISQLLEGQKHVNSWLSSFSTDSCTLDTLPWSDKKQETESKAEKSYTISGVRIDGEPLLRKRLASSKISSKKPAKIRRIEKTGSNDRADVETSSPLQDSGSVPSTSDQNTMKPAPVEISPDDVTNTIITGTASSKLSYLISSILSHYHKEKILVFYHGDNIAYYIAQMLELFEIKHEIYAKSLSASLKSEYVVRFEEEAQGVLLMDVHQAAYGLNLPSASRIYFVNPVCRPGIEAQAIKRGHRIGQKRQVKVETLILKDTIEEKMYERARRMSRAEHLQAKSLEDDHGIQEIIQSVRLLPISTEERYGRGQMAPLVEPQPLFRKPDREPSEKPVVAFVDVTCHDDQYVVASEDESENESLVQRWHQRPTVSAV